MEKKLAQCVEKLPMILPTTNENCRCKTTAKNLQKMWNAKLFFREGQATMSYLHNNCFSSRRILGRENPK
jgi:hypothetical protein